MSASGRRRARRFPFSLAVFHYDEVTMSQLLHHMRTLTSTAIGLCVLVLIAGCDPTSVIERTEPSTSVSQETAITTEDGALGVRAQMFGEFHDAVDGQDQLSTDWLLGPSSQADNTFFRASSGRHQGLNLNELRAGIGTFARGRGFDVINDANLLINGIEEGVLQEGQAAKFEAEARFIRALMMHHLVRIFGYDPAGPDPSDGLVQPNTGPGADFNLGIVIRTEPTLSLEQASDKPRSTVHEVYDQIETDLNTAISLFQRPDVSAEPPFFPSEAAAHALLARVQLYQKNYPAANQEAQTAIDQAGSFGARMAGEDELKSMWDEGTGPNVEGIWIVSTDPTTESAGVNDAISAFTSTQWVAQLPTQELVDLYDSGDARLEDWYAQCFNEEENVIPSGCGNVNRDSLELQKYISETNNQFADNYVHLRISEMKLIQAEARLKGASGSAAAPLNDIRSNRGLAGDLTDGEVDMDLILDERRRELVAEGHRYFDLKRLGRDISKSDGKLDQPPQDDLPFSDFKVLDDISPSELANNDSLIQNPGYR